MSFAGPSDPEIAHALAAAHKKGVVLVAAAGNAGAKSPPLFPASDANVIAVTATDAGDKLFKLANRGKHIAVAAPGVEILGPSTNGGYQISTGTSVAAAQVSGVAALLLERKPDLRPDALRKILASTATDLGPKGRDSQFGAGLVNAYRAIQSLVAVAVRATARPATPAPRPPLARARDSAVNLVRRIAMLRITDHISSTSARSRSSSSARPDRAVRTSTSSTPRCSCASTCGIRRRCRTTFACGWSGSPDGG